MGPRRPVDVVALVLACSLGGVALGIIVATTVQILHTGHGPEVELSDNATQVLVGATGALTGLLGGYLGSRRPPQPPEEPELGPPPPPPTEEEPTDEL